MEIKSIQSPLTDSLVSTTLAAGSAKSIMTYQLKMRAGESPELRISCESGVISTDHHRTRFGLVRAARRYYMVNNIFDESCTNLDGFIYSIQHCEAKRSCLIKFKPFWLKNVCQGLILDQEYLGFIKIHCQSKKNQKIKKFYFFY